jgi:DNA-binding transcriptional ArsR family regulator
LEIIKQGSETSNSDIVKALGDISRITVARDLRILLQQGLIEKVGHGRSVTYRSVEPTNPNQPALELVLSHADLFRTPIDIERRDLVIGFSEAVFRKSDDRLAYGDIDSKLNARLPSYFHPAVQIARMQSSRPRLIIVSGIYAALKWSARSDAEQKRMLINNNIKIDFLQRFFDRFFPDTFSLVEFRRSVDFLKISDHKLGLLWNVFEKKYPRELETVKKKLLQYKNPKVFANGEPTEEEVRSLIEANKGTLRDAFKYAIIHLFVFADVNLSVDFAHNPHGYCSIGEHNEAIFNIVRRIGYEIFKEVGEAIFDQEVFVFDNMKIAISDSKNAPPAYNGAVRGSGGGVRSIDEVTYENGYELEYYDTRERLKPSMDYLYRMIPKEDYVRFWTDYRARYFDLKKRYEEAYKIVDVDRE